MNEFSCSTREAAAALGICVRTVQLWVEKGRLRAWKTPGGHRRILRESVNEQLREREQALGGTVESRFDVLVVEDEPLQRQALASRLQGIDAQVSIRGAMNGIEGLIRIGERHPQVLITDLMMPGLDGFHLLNTLVSVPLAQSMHIIVMTGMSEAEILEKGGVPEGVVVFHKPLQLGVLVSLVRAYYEGWRLKKTSLG
jgi:excisionase family DNA binding protein